MYFLILFILPILFFLKLFIPRLMLFYPADFLLSDLIHVNFAQKYYLFKMLRQNELPFWTNQIAQGYPLLAESQIGALNIFNIILYKIFTPALAFNLTYLVGFIFLSMSLFFLGKYLYRQELYALLFSVSFTFSAIVMQQIVHQGILQNIFFIPIIFYFLFKGIDENKHRYLALSAFFFAQQFLFGHMFVNLGQLLFIVLFFILAFSYKKIKTLKILIAAILFFGIYLLIISPQLIQTFIFYLNSNRIDAVGSNLFTASFELKYLLSFFHPFPFGKVSDGSFFKNPAWQNTTTAPWEASIFVGYGLILILGVNLLTILLRKNNLKKTKKNTQNFYFDFFKISLLLAALLMFGGKSPLKIIFALPIINGFRILARFSLFTSFFIIGNILFQAKQVKIHKNFLIVALLLQVFGAFYFFYNYYPLVDSKLLFKKPKSTVFITTESKKSLYSFETQTKWFETFQKSGYRPISKYLYYHNNLYPYLNLLYNCHSCNVFRYSNYNPESYQKIVKFLDNELGLSIKKEKLTKKATLYLRLLGCDYLLLHSKIKSSPPAKPIAHNLFIYEVSHTLPKFSYFQNFKTYINDNQFLNLLEAGSIDFKSLYLSGISTNKHIVTNETVAKIDILTAKNQNIHLKLYTTTPGYLLVRQLNYPGWKAKVNEKTVPIIKADMLYMSIPVPKGVSKIEFVYNPPYLKTSLFTMSLGYLLTGFFLIFGNKNPRKDIF